MPTCELIIFERTTRWAAAVRNELAGRPPRVVEVRSLIACEAALAERRASLIAIETKLANLEGVLSLLTRLGQYFPAARGVAILSPDASDAERVIREAGAVDVFRSILDAPRMANMARRQSLLFPAELQTFDNWLAERLPWQAQATTAR